jgi:hypothetical protein
MMMIYRLLFLFFTGFIDLKKSVSIICFWFFIVLLTSDARVSAFDVSESDVAEDDLSVIYYLYLQIFKKKYYNKWKI